MRLSRPSTPDTVAQATPRPGQTLEVVAGPDLDRAARALAGVDSCGSQEDRLSSAASALAASTPAAWPGGRWRR